MTTSTPRLKGIIIGASLTLCGLGLLTLLWLMLPTHAARLSVAVTGLLLAMTGFLAGRFWKKMIAPAGSRALSGKNASADADKNPVEQQARLLSTILKELSHLHLSHDLLERYQAFNRMVETILSETHGPCSISLWCPNEDQSRLVECVIHSPPDQQHDRDKPMFVDERKICHVLLDSQLIRQVLNRRRALRLGEDQSVPAQREPDVSLPCDACIPLYRDYGAPLLINIVFEGGVEHLRRLNLFTSSVEKIELIWRHLQAVNQQTWSTQHDETTKALRDEFFLVQAEQQAQHCRCRDELFTVVVVTIRGFRRMFSSDAGQWRLLAGIMGRSLRSILEKKCHTYLLGKMADDVFAILLPRKDVFLAQSMMNKMPEQIRTEIIRDGLSDQLNVNGVELQWSIADHHEYQHSIEALLNTIYQRLFSRDQHDNPQIHHIALEQETPQQS